MSEANEVSPVERFVSADATHYLRCTHRIGLTSKEYVMRCIILKEMTGGRVKLLVFGERYWINKEYKKQIRYVNKSRVSEIEQHFKCYRCGAIAPKVRVVSASGKTQCGDCFESDEIKH